MKITCGELGEDEFTCPFVVYKRENKLRQMSAPPQSIPPPLARAAIVYAYAGRSIAVVAHRCIYLFASAKHTTRAWLGFLACNLLSLHREQIRW